MLDDKYIGLALAVSSSLAIGTSFIITKKGLNDAGARSAYTNASDNHAYLKNPIWWTGLATMVLGEVANFAAYIFAPPILVTPLGALSVIIGAILASFLLNEELGHLGRVGCALCLLGSLIIVLHAPADKDISTVDEMLEYAMQPGFMLYTFTVVVVILVMIYIVAPRYGKVYPIVYISICSLSGSICIMGVKGFGVAIKLTFSGNNQFTHASTYFFAIVAGGCIVLQLNYFNKALDIFNTNVVNPIYYVCFSTATIVASVILFQGFNTEDPANSLSLLVGFITTFLGVHLLEISRKPEPSLPSANGHGVLDSGLMNPRLSIGGRMSIDGWNGAAGTPIGGTLPFSDRQGHRRGPSQALFSVDDDDLGDAVGLSDLPEADEQEEDDDFVDERTHLRSDERRKGPRRQDSRGSQSPIEPPLSGRSIR